MIGFKPSASGLEYSTKTIGQTDCFDGTPSVGRGGPSNGFKYNRAKRSEKQDEEFAEKQARKQKENA